MLACQWICLFYVFDVICALFGETIRNMFGCVVILLLNVMELIMVVLSIIHHTVSATVLLVPSISVVVLIIVVGVAMCFRSSSAFSSCRVYITLCQSIA